MDIYQQKSKWKIWLAVLGAVIIIASFLYTQYLTPKLKAEERNRIQNVVDTYLANTSPPNGDPSSIEFQEWLDQDVTPFLKIIEGNSTIPMILENDRGFIDQAVNYPLGRMYLAHETEEERVLDTAYLRKRIRKIRKKGFEPVLMDNGFNQSYLWYEDSQILKLLNYFPFFQMALVIAFIGLGYIGFSNARRSEQNQVWAGMAKETAHQLGTPISAIIGWIEHLKLMHESDNDTKEVLGEFRKDVTRLELIADRFSKIGSDPELESRNIYEVLHNVFIYMQRRSPRKVTFDIPKSDFPIHVNINEHLFEWVIENLLRNAIDSSGGEGHISGKVELNNSEVTILISDTGKGIPTNKFKTIFQPGYTTKKRGWGLGLSLAKRIIESYHLGKIFVKSSIVDKGTTFAVKLPKA